MTDKIIALAMVGRSTVSFEVVTQWIKALRTRWWPGPVFLMPEIYAAGAWIGVVPLRNLVTYHALKDPSWDYLLWIDADHRIHHHLFDRVQAHARAGEQLVCGCYYSRSYPFEVQAFSEAVEGGVKFVPPTWLVPAFNMMMRGGYPSVQLAAAGVDFRPRDGVTGAPLIKVAGAGTGCMLVSREVLEMMAEVRGPGEIWRVDRVPWAEQIRLLEQGEMISGVLTEDIMFCLDVKAELSVTCWLDLDPRMETGHMGEMPVDRRQYLAAHQVTIPTGVDPAKVLPKGYEFVDGGGRRFGPVVTDAQGKPHRS